MAIPDISTMTVEELQQLMQNVNSRINTLSNNAATNAEALKVAAGADVQTLIDLIGPRPVEAVAGTASINEMLAQTKAVINADPAVYAKDILRLMRKIVKAQINSQRLVAGKTESTVTGN